METKKTTRADQKTIRITVAAHSRLERLYSRKRGVSGESMAVIASRLILNAPDEHDDIPCTCAGGTESGQPDPGCEMCGGDGQI